MNPSLSWDGVARTHTILIRRVWGAVMGCRSPDLTNVTSHSSPALALSVSVDVANKNSLLPRWEPFLALLFLDARTPCTLTLYHFALRSTPANRQWKMPLYLRIEITRSISSFRRFCSTLLRLDRMKAVLVFTIVHVQYIRFVFSLILSEYSTNSLCSVRSFVCTYAEHVWQQRRWILRHQRESDNFTKQDTLLS